MKRIIIIIAAIFALTRTDYAMAQKWYESPLWQSLIVTHDTITTHGITYQRVIARRPKHSNQYIYSIDNINNTLGNANLRRKDGKPLKYDDEEYGYGKIDMEAVRRALTDVFTKEENKALGDAKDNIWMHMVFATDDGRLLEVDFLPSGSQTIIDIPVEKFATLEHKLKESVTTDLSNDPELKELEFVMALVTMNFPFQRSYVDTDAKRNDMTRIDKSLLQ